MVPLITARCSGVHIKKPKLEILNFHPDDQFLPRFYWRARAASPIDRFDASKFPTRFGGQIRGFHAEGYIDGKSDRRLDYCLRYCIVAGKKALECTDIGGERLDKLKAEEEGDGGGSRAAAKKQAPKDWESISLSEKAVGLYVGEKGLLFWLHKLAYAFIFIVIGGWILFWFVGLALNL